MEGKALEVGKRYLLRVGGKQVPVRFVGRQERSQPALAPRWIAFAQQQTRPSFEVASVKPGESNSAGVEACVKSFSCHGTGSRQRL